MWRHLVATRSIGRDWNGLVRADACFFHKFRRSTAATLTFWTAASRSYLLTLERKENRAGRFWLGFAFGSCGERREKRRDGVVWLLLYVYVFAVVWYCWEWAGIGN
ncbi:hypothetical protein AABB24_021715 [Solanum stoloniferum]|uniref:Transmembrane protein n=1 Tax=Solanum stoloniferum TaxID=62892 RepID=A0ABD2SWI5_9SOLN